jgi:hypothetical protein
VSLENLRAELAGQKSGLQRLQQQMETTFRTLNGEIGTLKSQTEAVRQSVSRLENLRGGVNELKSRLEQPPKAPTPSTPSAPKSQNKVEIPMKEAKSLEGIISSLTKKHGGNVQEKGIVTITSKSVADDNPKYAPKNVADLTSDSSFASKDEPGQWVCWDFREMRVRPTHYTIRTYWLKSWVVEGSLDGSSWTEIGRQTNNQDFTDVLGNSASFAVSTAEFRFIRLTQTDKNHNGRDYLILYAVEFFGTLSE